MFSNVFNILDMNRQITKVDDSEVQGLLLINDKVF